MLKLLAFVLGIMLGATGALAQSVPAFQSGTVIPGHATKFFTNGLVGDAGYLASDVAVDPSRNSGQIVMYPSASWTNDPTNNLAWTILPPVGVDVPCQTTQSQCLVEAGAVAEARGLSLVGNCPGEIVGGGQYPYLSLAVPFDTGVLVQRHVDFRGCNITFSAAVTGAAFTINTMLDGGYVIWDGQVVGTYNTPSESTFVVLIKPTTCPPVEGCLAKVTANGRIRIGAVAGATTAGATPHGAVVGIDASQGSTFVDDIWIGEINGCGPCLGTPFHDGLRAFGASTTRGFFRNHLTIGYIHNVVTGIDLGSTDNTDTANPKNYKQNDILLEHISPGTTGGECAVIAGDLNTLKILSCNSDALYPSTYDNAVTLTTVSHQNTVDVNAVGYSHTISTYLGSIVFPFVDSGTTNNLTLNGSELQKWGGLIFCDGSSIPAGGIGACVGLSAPPPGAGGVRNYMPILSFSAGSGAAASSTATNSFGAITVGGSGAQTTVTVNFSGAGFLRAPGCFGASNAGFIKVTASSPTSITLTADAPMPAGTLVNYQCSTLL